MNRSIWYVFALAVLALNPPALHLSSGQENHRDIDKPGSYDKYLTPATMDRWSFHGKKGETVLVDVRTTEFDAVLSLLRTEADSSESVLQTADEEGSNCRLAFRLAADGRYKIGVNGFEQKGGGNYSLQMQKFIDREISIDRPIEGTTDRDGNAYFYFTLKGEQYFTIDTLGSGLPGHFSMMDEKGGQVNPWGALYRLEEPETKEPGEFRLRLAGQPKRPFRFLLKPAVRGTLQDALELTLSARQAAVLDLAGSVGQFRMFELRSDRPLTSRFLFAKPNPHEPSLDMQTARPEMTMLAEYEKGKRKYSAIMLGRTDRYQLQFFSALANEDSQVAVRAFDPSETLEIGGATQQRLMLGDCRFYRLAPKPGQTTTFRVTSEEFDPVIQLFDQEGNSIGNNDDFDAELSSRVRYTSYTDSQLILAVKSLGNGGSGVFQLDIQTDVPKPIAVGETKTQNMSQAGSELWLYTAKKDESVIFFCKSSSPASMIIRNAQGVVMGSQGSSDERSGMVRLIRFPEEGEYSIEATTAVGQEYSLQAIGVQ